MDTTRTANSNFEKNGSITIRNETGVIYNGPTVFQPGETLTDGRGIQYLVGENGNLIRKTSKRMSKKKLRQRLAAERRRRLNR